VLEGFDETQFEALGKERVVYRRGEGPGVLIMHEAPGITPPVAEFARRVADAGFRVALPMLFGTAGKPMSAGYVLSSLTRACVSREFHVMASHRSSPITDWLRVLARDLHERAGGAGIGAIGMCLTGNFALALWMEPALLAPVLSQPSLPFGVGSARRAALHSSDEEIANARRRVGEGGRLLGLRFTSDPMCPPERFESLRRELREGFEAIEIDSSAGNAHGIPRTAHSVLTVDLVDKAGHPTQAALHRTLEFLKERLVPAGAGA
jgi:dienelactone hydrolase